jgi:putative oxidoreductase
MRNLANNKQSTDLSVLLVRVSLGAILIAHSLLKIFVFTLAGTAGFFESVGFPGWAAYLVAPLELVAGGLLIAGYKVKIVAAVVLPVLLGAAYVHIGNGWLFTNKNGGWEFPVLLVMLAISLLVHDIQFAAMRPTGTHKAKVSI